MDILNAMRFGQLNNAAIDRLMMLNRVVTYDDGITPVDLYGSSQSPSFITQFAVDIPPEARSITRITLGSKNSTAKHKAIMLTIGRELIRKGRQLV